MADFQVKFSGSVHLLWISTLYRSCTLKYVDSSCVVSMYCAEYQIEFGVNPSEFLGYLQVLCKN